MQEERRIFRGERKRERERWVKIALKENAEFPCAARALFGEK